MNTPATHMTAAQIDALQARFALRVCSRLDDGLATLSHDISERLRVARQQAVAEAMSGQLQSLAPAANPSPAIHWHAGQVVAAGRGGHPHARPSLDEGSGWGWRLASALPAFVLLAGLWGIQWWHEQQQIQAMADIDVALLADELPPSAYADAGFEEFLQSDMAAAQPAAQSLPVSDRSAAQPGLSVPLRTTSPTAL